MELRRLAVCMALVLLAVSTCSEARHSRHRREASDDINYDDQQLADEASEDDTQNDTENDTGKEEQEEEIPAIILTKPTNYEVAIGRNVRLECQVSPNTTVVQWFKDGEHYFFGTLQIVDLATVKGRLSIVNGTKDLLIKDLKISDSGVYKCETLQTKPTAINHTVIVVESPKIIRFTASDSGRVKEGSDLLLTCDVTGSPKPEIVWSRQGTDGGNERLLEKDGEFSENSVYIKGVNHNQAGKYYCYAFNKVGNSQAETTVIVLRKPIVHVHKTIVNSAVNVEAILQCSAHEEPATYIRWYKDGKLIEDSSSQFSITTRDSQSNLTVTPTAAADFGTYTCEAGNDHGKHNKSIELVQSPVVEDLYVEGSKMSWIVHSHQPLEKIEVQLRNQDGDNELRLLSVPLPENPDHIYEIIYLLEDKQLEPGKYEAVVKVKNNNSWGGNADPVFVDIEPHTEYIQHASVFRGNDAHSIRPTISAILSTTLMYLLVRMF